MSLGTIESLQMLIIVIGMGVFAIGVHSLDTISGGKIFDKNQLNEKIKLIISILAVIILFWLFGYLEDLKT